MRICLLLCILFAVGGCFSPATPSLQSETSPANDGKSPAPPLTAKPDPTNSASNYPSPTSYENRLDDFIKLLCESKAFLDEVSANCRFNGNCVIGTYENSPIAIHACSGPDDYTEFDLLYEKAKIYYTNEAVFILELRMMGKEIVNNQLGEVGADRPGDFIECELYGGLADTHIVEENDTVVVLAVNRWSDQGESQEYLYYIDMTDMEFPRIADIRGGEADFPYFRDGRTIISLPGVTYDEFMEQYGSQ